MFDLISRFTSIKHSFYCQTVQMKVMLKGQFPLTHSVRYLGPEVWENPKNQHKCIHSLNLLVATDSQSSNKAFQILFHKYNSMYCFRRWGILFSHPRDYTPVCTTELSRVIELEPEFRKRNVNLIALSCDSVSDHNGWSKVNYQSLLAQDLY